MAAIPKALAMANPKHIVACVATAAGVIASKFATDGEGKAIDYTDIDLDRKLWDDQRVTDEGRCAAAYENCEKSQEECA